MNNTSGIDKNQTSTHDIIHVHIEGLILLQVYAIREDEQWSNDIKVVAQMWNVLFEIHTHKENLMEK